VVTTTFASPLGEILLAADGRGLTGLWFEGQEHFGSTLLREDSEHVEGVDAVSGTGGMSSVSPANGAASSVLLGLAECLFCRAGTSVYAAVAYDRHGVSA